MSSPISFRKPSKDDKHETSPSSHISPIAFANSTLASLSRFSLFIRLQHGTPSASKSVSNNNTSTSHEICVRKSSLLRMGIERPADLEYVLRMDPLPLEKKLEHTWSSKDRSSNIHISSNRMVFTRNPIAQSTDAIRGKQGYSDGLHIWRIGWDRTQRGTHAVIGVGTEYAPLEANGYVTLLGGESEHGWGWNICNNVLYHNSISYGDYPSLELQRQLEQTEQEEAGHCEGGVLSVLMNANSNTSGGFRVPNDIYVVLDMDEGTLGFMVKGEFLGYAFRNLKGHKVYPMVSAVWGRCQVTLDYINGLPPHPCSLMHSCRKCIHKYLATNKLDPTVLSTLYLPHSIKDYLLYR